MTGRRRRIGFRTDATPALGGGHVMRCLALAAELQQRGADVVFCSVEGSPVTAPALGRSDFRIQLLASEAAPITGMALDALVVDHYGLSAAHETGFRAIAPVIAVIDDLVDRPHDCDILVDITAGRRPEAYTGLAPDALCLTGAGYAMLRPAFRRMRPASLARHAETGPVRRILLSFGLTDPGGVTAPAAETLLAAAPEAHIDVVVRRGTSAWAWLEPLASRSGRLALHDDPPELADLMAGAEMAVGAGGVTSWERCSLGLPAIVAQLAGNQRDNVAALTGAGAALALTDPFDMGAELAALTVRLSDPDVRRAMSAAASRLCDGEGARRVADAILNTIDAKATARRFA